MSVNRCGAYQKQATPLACGKATYLRIKTLRLRVVTLVNGRADRHEECRQREKSPHFGGMARTRRISISLCES